MMQNSLSWRDKGGGIHINSDKRKKKLTTFKILAVSVARVMCSALHLLCSCWKSRVALVSSCAEHPTAGTAAPCLASNTLASNPEKPCLVSTWSPTICPVWPDYSFDRWPEQPSAKYSKLQLKAALISFQRLKSTHKVTLSTQRWLLFLLLMRFHRWSD